MYVLFDFLRKTLKSKTTKDQKLKKIDSYLQNHCFSSLVLVTLVVEVLILLLLKMCESVAN